MYGSARGRQILQYKINPNPNPNPNTNPSSPYCIMRFIFGSRVHVPSRIFTAKVPGSHSPQGCLAWAWPAHPFDSLSALVTGPRLLPGPCPTPFGARRPEEEVCVCVCVCVHVLSVVLVLCVDMCALGPVYTSCALSSVVVVAMMSFN